MRATDGAEGSCSQKGHNGGTAGAAAVARALDGRQKLGLLSRYSAQQGMLTGKQHSLTGREIECLSMLAASAGCCRLMCGSFRYCAAR